jgi:very-short-patch-repair endonuclease
MQHQVLRRLAGRQHGLITIDQAVGAGMSRATWYRRVASGALLELHPGVAALGGAPATAERAVLAAVLSLGPGVVASHRSAAYLWGAEVDGAHPVDVIARREARGRRRGVAVHRPVDAHHVRAVVRADIAVTTPSRTLVELGAVSSRRTVERVYEQFLVAGTISPAAAQAALVRHARRGRAGVGVLRSVLDGWTIGDRPPDSELEVAVARLLQRYGLPAPQFQHLVTGPGFRSRVDFAYPELRIVIEVDGWRFHATRAAFEADRQRDAMLESAGWTVLRFTWLQVSRRPAWVAERVAATLAARSRAAASHR